MGKVTFEGWDFFKDNDGIETANDGTEEDEEMDTGKLMPQPLRGFIAGPATNYEKRLGQNGLPVGVPGIDERSLEQKLRETENNFRNGAKELLEDK